jgi:hypothetical protein
MYRKLITRIFLQFTSLCYITFACSANLSPLAGRDRLISGFWRKSSFFPLDRKNHLLSGFWRKSSYFLLFNKNRLLLGFWRKSSFFLLVNKNRLLLGFWRKISSFVWVILHNWKQLATFQFPFHQYHHDCVRISEESRTPLGSVSDAEYCMREFWNFQGCVTFIAEFILEN